MKPTISSGFFVTGTDTGIGKTFISRLLIEAFIKTMQVTYLKPVQTGCFTNVKDELISPDFEYILQGTLQPSADYCTHVPYRFKAACSPHLACRLEKQDISFDHIGNCLKKLSKEKDSSRLVIVEGAGGVYTPLGKSAFMIDLMAYLNLPIILVVSPKLGTLNHTLLSINALRGRSLRLAAVVMNDSNGLPQDFIYADNKEFLREMILPAPFIDVKFNALPSQSMEDFCCGLLR